MPIVSVFFRFPAHLLSLYYLIKKVKGAKISVGENFFKFRIAPPESPQGATARFNENSCTQNAGSVCHYYAICVILTHIAWGNRDYFIFSENTEKFVKFWANSLAFFWA
jgi:hypothetical protein